MTDTLTTLAETLTSELAATVAATERARNLQIAGSIEALAICNQRRVDGLTRAEDLEREAARLISEALSIRAETERSYMDDMRAVVTEIEGLKTREPEKFKPQHAVANGQRFL